MCIVCYYVTDIIMCVLYCVYVFPCTASAKAFDQYGKLTEDLEEQMEMRERAETMALEVLQYICVIM